MICSLCMALRTESPRRMCLSSSPAPLGSPHRKESARHGAEVDPSATRGSAWPEGRCVRGCFFSREGRAYGLGVRPCVVVKIDLRAGEAGDVHVDAELILEVVMKPASRVVRPRGLKNRAAKCWRIPRHRLNATNSEITLVVVLELVGHALARRTGSDIARPPRSCAPSSSSWAALVVHQPAQRSRGFSSTRSTGSRNVWLRIAHFGGTCRAKF